MPAPTSEEQIRLRAMLDPVGVWTFALDRHPVQRGREVVAEIEELGYPVMWIPEGLGSKEALSHAALLLSAGSRIVVATGVANVWARDPVATASGARTLHDAFPGRVVLGLGVSHRTLVARRGAQRYERPLARMREYLQAMEEARYGVRPVPELPPLVLGALGPNMLRLAAEKSSGAHPYFVPVEHTARSREILGPDPILAPQQAVLLERDAARAREIARAYVAPYLRFENYSRNLLRLGFSEEELTELSDRLVDAVVAWGDVEDVKRRVRDHLDAGADHVCVQVLSADPADVCLEEFRELAPALLPPS